MTPSLRTGARSMSDGVGCWITVGVSDNRGSQTMILSLRDSVSGHEAYALLTPEEARTLARDLIDMADRAEAGES